MPAAPVLPKLVGQRVKRREDPRLIQGRGTYVDDVKIAGMQHIAFKRSDVAHGKIKKIDVSAAKAMEGVEAVFTALAFRDQVAPPTANLVNVDPQCDLDFAPLAARKMRIRGALSNSFGFGGTNATLVFRAVQ